MQMETNIPRIYNERSKYVKAYMKTGTKFWKIVNEGEYYAYYEFGLLKYDPFST